MCRLCRPTSRIACPFLFAGTVGEPPCPDEQVVRSPAMLVKEADMSDVTRLLLLIGLFGCDDGKPSETGMLAASDLNASSSCSSELSG